MGLSGLTLGGACLLFGLADARMVRVTGCT